MDIVSWAEMNRRIPADILGSRGVAERHIAIVAPTGGGKTTLAIRGILPHFEHALIVDSTGDPNPPMADYGRPVRKWGAIEGHQRLTLNDVGTEAAQKVLKYLNRAFQQGNTAIYIDEVRQVADGNYLGLRKALEYVLLFGRKRGVCMVGVTQAPRFVPSAFYDQSQMHFIFRIRDIRAQKRLEEISGDVDALRAITPQLEKYQFAYVNPDGDVVVSKYAGKI